MLMKISILARFIILCGLCITMSTARAQYVAIPDTAFGSFLNTNGYSSCLTGNSISGWHLDTTCSLVLSDTALSPQNRNIHNLTGVQYFKHLKGLYCEQNQLASLPPLPSTLTHLYCYQNQLTSLPILPTSLVDLECENNSLTSLSTLPTSLVYLVCYYNRLTSLPTLPASLITLRCDDNHLTNIPTLPASLSFLNCTGNSLNNLPALPSLLNVLHCDSNQLTSLPIIPNSLQILSCSANQLTSLPILPNSLTSLDCSSNRLASLPNFLGPMQSLFCQNNQLTTLPILSDSIQYLACANNPSISCLPYLNNNYIYALYISGTNIQCMPDTIVVGYYDIRPDSLPICGIGNANGCPVYIIPDSVVWPGDANADHIVDNNDLLPIGLAYDSSGPVRTVQGIVWQGDRATAWRDSFSNYTYPVNYKHADCNGDGTVNATDTAAIIQNFSLTHAKTGGISAPWRSGVPSLSAIPTIDTLGNGAILTINFELGNTSIPFNNFYGLAFTYDFDPLIVDSAYTSITYGNSWIGTNDKIALSKIFNSTGQIKTAVTRIDHTTRSGSGVIASASFRINTHNVTSNNFYYYANIGTISNVTAIDQHGNTIPLNTGADTSRIVVTPLGIRTVANIGLVHLYPNPNNGSFTLETSLQQGAIYSISDMLGQLIQQGTIASEKQKIDMGYTPAGVYSLSILGMSGQVKFAVIK